MSLRDFAPAPCERSLQRGRQPRVDFALTPEHEAGRDIGRLLYYPEDV